MAGKITEFRVQKKNKDRVSVFIEGSFAFGLPAIAAAGLKCGQFLSDGEIQALQEQGTVEDAYDQTLNYLSYRPRSRAEVVAYLQKREVSEEQVQLVVSRLERAGLVDDEAFVRFWVENRERFRPRGPRALRYELRGKGISDQLIDQALASVDEAVSAHRAASNKARQLSHLERRVFLRKLIDHLARRGFGYDVAQEVAEQTWTELAAGEQ